MAGSPAFDEREIATAIIDQVRLVLPGVKGYPGPASRMLTPCIVPTFEYEFNMGFGGKGGKITCDILVLVQGGDGDSGQRTLHRLLSGTDTEGLKYALENDETLGGAVQGLRVVGPQSKLYERYDGDGNITYYGRYLRTTIYP